MENKPAYDPRGHTVAINPDGCASRQSAQSLLSEHADRLRRDAGRLHQQADSIEQLARCASAMTGLAEDALWRLAIDAISRATPRPF